MYIINKFIYLGLLPFRIINKVLKSLFNPIAYNLYFFYVRKIGLVKRPEKPRLFWGTIPIISNKYWSNSLKRVGYVSDTIMENYYPAYSKTDFDYYMTEFSSWIKFIPAKIFFRLPDESQRLIFFLYCIKNYDIFHLNFMGGILRTTILEEKEAELLKLANCKIIILPYGGDYLQYSKVIDVSLRHALISDYPLAGRNEKLIEVRLSNWQKNADVIIPGLQIDGLSRWDCLPFNPISIDEHHWKCKEIFSKANGRDRPVKIVHTPNHRTIKGTEFIIKAIKDLQEENLQIEFILIEGKSNLEVKEILENQADILVEQIILSYALSAIEGMACGLPVLGNLDIEHFILFRRYSYLDECPILSTNHENIKENLRVLIQNPDLREELGLAGRSYVEKYHSIKTAQYMFNSVYDKIWYNKEVDLINIFHPLKSDYVKGNKVKHPLINSKLTAEYLKEADLP